VIRGRPAEPEPDELRLVIRANAGDADAFGQVYDAYADRVYRYIFFPVTDEPTAEDLTSQVFLKAWESLPRYQPSDSLMAWLYSIARNTVIDHYRTRKQTVSLDEVATVLRHDAKRDEHVDLEYEVQSLKTPMRGLTDEQREVLTWKFIAGLDTTAIARRTRKRRRRDTCPADAGAAGSGEGHEG
jgi:RNA polymerase sigma-70 factor (ECF subfamily)